MVKVSRNAFPVKVWDPEDVPVKNLLKMLAEGLNVISEMEFETKVKTMISGK